MIYLLDALEHTPAQVADDVLTVVAQNRAAENLLGVWTGLPGYQSNVTWRWFADPASRDSNDPAEHERIGRAYAADLRAGLAHRSTGDRLVLFRPRPGSNAHEQIRFLTVLGNPKFA